MTSTDESPTTRPSRRVNPRHRVVFVATLAEEVRRTPYVGVGATFEEAVRLLARWGTQWNPYGDTITALEAVEYTFGPNTDERSGFLAVGGRGEGETPAARVEPRHVVPEGGTELDVEDESGHLYAGRPGCVHLIESAPGGGVRCVHDDCDAWFCY